MKNARKILAAALACVMLLTTLGAIPVFAAEETVLLDENFDAGSIGRLSATENTAAEALVKSVKDGGNGVLYVYREAANETDAKPGPRASYKLDLSKYESLTISAKIKANGVHAVIGLYTAEPKKTTELYTMEENKWQDVVVKVDMKTSQYTVTVDGKAGKGGKIHDIDEYAGAQIRFGGRVLQPGQGTYYDDIKITAVEASGAATGTPTETPTPASDTPAFAPTTKANLPTIPKDANVFLNTDFTGVAENKKAINAKLKGSKIFSSGTDYIQLISNNGDMMARYWATDGKEHGPRLGVALNPGVTKHSIDLAAIPSGDKSYMYFTLYADGKKQSLGIELRAGKNGVSGTDWNYVHLDIDMAACTVDGTVNGKTFETKQFEAVQTLGSAEFWFNSIIEPNEVIYMDAIAYYTPEKVEYDGPLKGNQEIAWENVVPSKPIDSKSFVKNVTKHPRVFVHDWDEMRAKIDQTYLTRQWYANIKAAAEKALVSAPTGYAINSRGNVLESARAARDRIVQMAFVYKIEGDKRYLDKVYEEMLAYGEWPDWSGFTSTLVTAEILQGYAYCYDWLHDDFTPEQRQTILDIVKKQALPDFIYAYEGQISNTSFTTSTINWNPVCNATIIAWALATADETPEISEYLLEKAPPFIQNALPPYAPQGGYPEGVSYWDYGTSFLVFAVDFLEKGFVEGFQLPENYVYWKAPGIADTPDYAIYFDGPTGRFNYGDCSVGHTNCEVMYWAAERFNKPYYAWWEDQRQLSSSNLIFGGYSAIAALCWYNPDNAYYVPGAFSLDKFYSSADGVNGASMRSSWNDSTALFAAIQGGNNKANHQHYSLGTYVVDYMGQRFIRQLNSYDYSLKNPKAEIYYKRDESSNCLVINPTATRSQESKAVGKTIKTGTSDNTAFSILDLTSTYADYQSAKRGLMLTDNRSRVIVQDEVVAKFPSEFYWFANTDASIKLAKDGKSAVLTMGGAQMLARIIEGPAEAKFEVMERKSLFDSVVQIEANKGGEKLVIHVKDKTELNLAVEYVPFKEGEGIPAPGTYVPLDNWTADDNGMISTAVAGSNVVLKLNTPNAIAKGVKTFVDTANTDVVPFTENSRTLVPVRFISESFGAKVGWNDITQTVLVDYNDKQISLDIGSREMKVNGETVMLDTPANTYNSRTLIPLRALVEALGKSVFWDDRGLIVISDDPVSYTEEQIAKLIGELDVRVTVDGKDIAFFETDRSEYTLDVKSGAPLPVIGVSTIGGETVSATQATSVGDAATVTINDKVYTFKTQTDAFEGLIGHKDPSVIKGVQVEMKNNALPAYDTFIYVEDLMDSTGFTSYPKRGLVDGVINTGTANRWAAQGEDQWIQVDFGSEKALHSMAFAGDKQDQRAYYFDVLVSSNGKDWTTVHTGGAQKTTDVMYIIPLGDVKARFVRMVGKGNSVNGWNTYCEARFYESAAQQAEDISYWPAYFGSSGISGKAGTTGMVSLSGVNAQNKTLELLPDAVVSYEVADPTVATIAADGTVTFLKAGQTTVKVTVTQSGFTASATANIIVD